MPRAWKVLSLSCRSMKSVFLPLNTYFILGFFSFIVIIIIIAFIIFLIFGARNQGACRWYAQPPLRGLHLRRSDRKGNNGEPSKLLYTAENFTETISNITSLRLFTPRAFERLGRPLRGQRRPLESSASNCREGECHAGRRSQNPQAQWDLYLYFFWPGN